MRHVFSILFCALCISVYAVDFMPMQPVMQPATMQSVNKSGIMNSGSTYAPVVYEVGASNPSPAMGPRRVTPGTDNSGYDPNNPTLPLGDAVLPLLLMALAYMVIRVRRKRQVADN